MTTEEEANDALIVQLVGLHKAHDEANNNNARGKLANLRHAMRDHLHDDYPIGRVFPALAPIKKGKSAELLTDNLEHNEWRTLVAGLFGFAHDDVEHSKHISLGAALRTMFEKRENDSLERRFMALLNADAEHLPGHLRQAISLLKAESIGLDWGMLLNDVCAWNMTGKPVQKRWIQHYYRSRKDEPTAPEAAPAQAADADNVSK